MILNYHSNPTRAVRFSNLLKAHRVVFSLDFLPLISFKDSFIETESTYSKCTYLKWII